MRPPASLVGGALPACTSFASPMSASIGSLCVPFSGSSMSPECLALVICTTDNHSRLQPLPQHWLLAVPHTPAPLSSQQIYYSCLHGVGIGRAPKTEIEPSPSVPCPHMRYSTYKHAINFQVVKQTLHLPNLPIVQATHLQSLHHLFKLSHLYNIALCCFVTCSHHKPHHTKNLGHGKVDRTDMRKTDPHNLLIILRDVP